MRILVTGGAGYVGSVMVPALLEAGHHVRVFDSLRKGGLGLLPHFARPDFEFVAGDVRDERAVRCVLKDVDAVIHLAAIVGYPACDRDPWMAQQVNVEATALLDRCRSRSQVIVFGSTLSHYGAVADGVCTEESVPQPLTHYGRTKVEAEQLLLDAGGVVVFRPATAFGLSPQMRLDLLLNDFVYRAVTERRLTVYEGRFRRAFVHVRDFARAFLFALDHADDMVDQVFNLGSESLNLTKEELARRIRERVEFDLELSPHGSDPDKRDYLVDFSKLRRLGYVTAVDLEQGIDELARAAAVLRVHNPFSNASL